MCHQILLHDAIMCIRCKYDFVITPMVDGTLVCSPIVEVGRTNPNDHLKGTVGVENIGCFLVKLVDGFPKLI